MKIWIISSNPYIAEFEKLASLWSKKERVEVKITPVVNFGLGYGSVKRLLTKHKQIRPDVIITDHGHLGFASIKLATFLRRKRPKIYVYLRGNYWLESKNYIKTLDIDIITSFQIDVIAKNQKAISLIDRFKNQIVYEYQKISYLDKKLETITRFSNIWPGNYNLSIITEKEKKVIPLSLTHDEIIKNKEIGVRISKIIVKKSFSLGLLKEYFKIWLLKKGWNMTFKYSDNLITVCDYLSKGASQNIKKKATVCPIGIDIYNLKSKQKVTLKKPSVVLIQNHQIKEKSEALIKFSKVIESLPNVNFYISKGLLENRNNENHREVIEELNKYPNVIFSNIDHENKMAYLEAADIYLLVSGLDCTPATILEAGLAEKPILASHVGGVPEMIAEGKTGWTIENGNSKKWIEKINYLISKPEKAREMGGNAKKFVLKNYEMEYIADKFYKIIKA